MKALSLIAMGLATSAVVAHAQVLLADYQFTGNSLASADAGTNWTTTDLASGGGVPLTFDGGQGSPSAPAITLTMGDINDGTFIDDDYYTFSITPDGGQQIDFTSFTFDFQKASGGADVDWEVRSSVDSFASAIGSGSISPQGSWVTGNTATVTGLGSQTAATEFRIYLTTGGTFGPNVLYLDNIQVEGNVSAVPEPSSFALLAGMFGLSWTLLRRLGEAS